MADRWWQRVEEAIQRAIDAGEFEALSGVGRALSLDHTDYHAGERDVAYRLLSNAGLAPDFLLLRREIVAEITSARAFIRAAVRRRHRRLAQMRRAPLHEMPRLHRQAWDEWYASVAEFRQRVCEINARVQLFNMKNKIPRLHQPCLDAEAEIERAEAEVAP